MNALILIGVKRTPKGRVVENLYTGLDGDALATAAEKARKSKAYVEIGRITNPNHTPMAIDPHETEATTPVFVRPKAKEAPKDMNKTPAHMLERDAQERNRRARLAASTPKEDPKASEEGSLPASLVPSEPAKVEGAKGQETSQGSPTPVATGLAALEESLENTGAK